MSAVAAALTFAAMASLAWYGTGSRGRYGPVVPGACALDLALLGRRSGWKTLFEVRRWPGLGQPGCIRGAHGHGLPAPTRPAVTAYCRFWPVGAGRLCRLCGLLAGLISGAALVSLRLRANGRLT